ncbi:MAG: Twin-arginine translocation protein TatA [Nitrosopumilales archaeon]|nr:MAG: Twin-arginine translocation protein TatA [Nitrosopumilales archaeon]
MLENIANFVAGAEWIWIVVIIAVFLFGAKKIPQLAKTFGKAKGEYEKGRVEGDKELKEFKEKQKDQSD